MSPALDRLLVRFLPFLLAGLLAACSGGKEEPAKGPVVLAASSLQEALEDAADGWAAQGHARPVLSFAGSSALARQVESGAPADLFISADEDWMDELEQGGFLAPGTRATLLGNSLVVIAPEASTVQIDLADRSTFRDALAKGPLAMADPDAVPAGKYGKAALERLGLWSLADGRIARGENVRAALALVERGEAPLGIVYGSDALASKKVRVAAIFPAESHPPIRYPVAQLKSSTHPDAAGFRAYLASEPAQVTFSRHGFIPPPAGAE